MPYKATVAYGTELYENARNPIQIKARLLMESEGLNFARDLWRQIVAEAGRLEVEGLDEEYIREYIRKELAEGGIRSRLETRFKRMSPSYLNWLAGQGQEEVRKIAIDEDTRMTWVVNSFNTCPSCLERNGQTKTYAEWRAIGLPKSEVLICRKNCKCDLIPEDMAVGLATLEIPGK